MRSHNLEHKSAKRKRSFRKPEPVAGGDTNAIKKMLRLR
jgi:ribosomal protein L35